MVIAILVATACAPLSTTPRSSGFADVAIAEVEAFIGAVQDTEPSGASDLADHHCTRGGAFDEGTVRWRAEQVLPPPGTPWAVSGVQPGPPPRDPVDDRIDPAWLPEVEVTFDAEEGPVVVIVRTERQDDGPRDTCTFFFFLRTPEYADQVW